MEALLDAYEALPQAIRRKRQLVIVGKYGWNAESLRRRLEDTRPQNRCVWLDYVPREELYQLYAGAGTFVFPSLAEGFGLPILEALAKGSADHRKRSAGVERTRRALRGVRRRARYESPDGRDGELPAGVRGRGRAREAKSPRNAVYVARVC